VLAVRDPEGAAAGDRSAGEAVGPVLRRAVGSLGAHLRLRAAFGTSLG
jgi:hypothetical protein